MTKVPQVLERHLTVPITNKMLVVKSSELLSQTRSLSRRAKDKYLALYDEATTAGVSEHLVGEAVRYLTMVYLIENKTDGDEEAELAVIILGAAKHWYEEEIGRRLGEED